MDTQRLPLSARLLRLCGVSSRSLVALGFEAYSAPSYWSGLLLYSLRSPRCSAGYSRIERVIPREHWVATGHAPLLLLSSLSAQCWPLRALAYLRYAVCSPSGESRSLYQNGYEVPLVPTLFTPDLRSRSLRSGVMSVLG